MKNIKLKSKIEFVEELRYIFDKSIQSIKDMRDNVKALYPDCNICIKYDKSIDLIEFHLDGDETMENILLQHCETELYNSDYKKYTTKRHIKVSNTNKDTIDKISFDEMLYEILEYIMKYDNVLDYKNDLYYLIKQYPIILRYDLVEKLFDKRDFKIFYKSIYNNIVIFDEYYTELNLYYFIFDDNNLVELDRDELKIHVDAIEYNVERLRNILR